jgi:membrane protease YdiL (CAAX protease family)
MWPQELASGTIMDSLPDETAAIPPADAGGRDSAAGVSWVQPESAACADVEPAAAAPRARYCRHCGTAFAPDALVCQVCSGRLQRPAGALATAGAVHDQLVSALALYFVLLMSTLVAILARPSVVTAVLAVTVAHTVFGLSWAVAKWREILPGLRCLSAPGWYLAAAIGAILTFMLASTAVRLLVQAFGATEILIARPLRDAGYGWRMVVLVGCVQPAIVEELAFRGVILSAMLQILGRRDAIIVSALLFMLLHLAVLGFPHLLLIGLALGYMRVRSGSLYPCMLMHLIHNLLCALSESSQG